ncbi:50S ribosomal protein L10 [Candidatus Providencia siddallii]|uniref:Large ribosomal subunit protein uL10 n=1 Tax=Candidatus Providencia siddallii TaxID=1715285 RepID=A0ABM9NNK5_9GAMM
MPLNLQDKKNIIDKLNKIAKKAMSAVIADPRGISSVKLTELRKIGRKTNVYIRVVRNTLIRIAIKKTNYEILDKFFTGPTLIAFSNKHPNAAARVCKEFEKIDPLFKIKVAAFEKKIIKAEDIETLASIPTFEESITILILTIKEAAFGKIIRTIVALQKTKN